MKVKGYLAVIVETSFGKVAIEDKSKPYFQKLDPKDSKWTHGRAFYKLPGCIVVTPTNFSRISYLDLDEYSYNYFYRTDDRDKVPRFIVEEYFHRKYLRSRDPAKHKAFSGLETRHMNRTRNCIIDEYDQYILRQLQTKWDSQKFRNFLEYYKSFGKWEYFRSNFVYRYFTAVLYKHCTDSTLIVDYFNTVCTYNAAVENMFVTFTPFLKFYLEHSLKIGFDPWSLMRKFQVQKDSPIMRYCPVEMCVIHGSFDHLKLLLTYGCPLSPSNYAESTLNKKIDGRWWNRNRSIPIVMPGNSTSDTSHDSSTPFHKSSRYLAHFTVVLFLAASNAAVYQKTDPSSTNHRFIESIKLFMRSVPESYVSYEEMLWLMDQLAPSLSNVVTPSCNWYKAAFPRESSRSKRPRSLMHLSRCAIRQNCPLPNGISKLSLPDSLKSYLNLEY